MPVSKELRASALGLSHHQRRALKLLGANRRHADGMTGIGKTTLEALVAAGLAVNEQSEANQFRFDMTERGREIYDALNELGWFPPEPHLQGSRSATS